MSEFLKSVANLNKEQLLILVSKLYDKIHTTKLSSPPKDQIAIVGIGCRFPGATGPESFWNFLRDGQSGIVEVSPERWRAEYYSADRNEPGKMYSKWAGLLGNIKNFDANFFGISPRETEGMNPEQRLALEVTFHALEDAGLKIKDIASTNTGVYIGQPTFSEYYGIRQSLDEKLVDAYTISGASNSMTAGRISFFLGLKGPAISVDTACSSSLTSLHLAAKALQLGECEMALAGGVDLIISPKGMIGRCKAKMLSPDGLCHTFDASANGYVRGEGAGMLVLKKLSRALADGDRIYGLLLGSALNQDGRTSGITVPNGKAQEAVIQKALDDAELKPEDVHYVEAHGTGTSLGDPIEFDALTSVYGRSSGRKSQLYIGSVKTNVGHLEAAAGIVGAIKTLLSIYHSQIPKHLNFKNWNPEIQHQGSGVEIPQQLTPWPVSEKPRVGAVSSFGFSGTNSHVIFSSYDTSRGSLVKKMNWDWPTNFIFLSAKSKEALNHLTTEVEKKFFAPRLEELSGDVFSQIASNNLSRNEFKFRRIIQRSVNKFYDLTVKNHEPEVALVIDESFDWSSDLMGYLQLTSSKDFREQVENSFAKASINFDLVTKSSSPEFKVLRQFIFLKWLKFNGLNQIKFLTKNFGDLLGLWESGLLFEEDFLTMVRDADLLRQQFSSKALKQLLLSVKNLSAIPSTQPFFSLTFGTLVGDIKTYLNLIEENRYMSDDKSLLSKYNIISTNCKFDELFSALVLQGKINWRILYSRFDFKRTNVVPYSFDKTEFWIDSMSNVPNSVTPVAVKKVFDVPVSLETQSYLMDHHLKNDYILPATFFMSSLLEVLRKLERNNCGIKSFTVGQSFILQEGGNYLLRIIVENDNVEFRKVISSSGEELKCATASISEIKRVESTFHGLEEPFLLGNYEEWDHNYFYKHLKEVGFDHGPLFQVVKWVKKSSKMAYACVELPSHLEEEKQRIHPVLLDGVMQILTAFLPKGRFYLPFSFENISFNDIGSKVYVFLDLTRSSQDERAFSCKLLVFDQFKNSCGEMQNFTLVEKRSTTEKRDKVYDQNFYSTVWDRLQQQDVEDGVNLRPGKTIYIKGKSSFGRLKDDEVYFDLNETGEAFIYFEQAKKSLSWLLEQGLDQIKNRLLLIVDVSELSMSTDTDELRKHLFKCHTFILEITKALQYKKLNNVDFVIRTCNANLLSESVNPFQYTFVGFARALALEQPNWRVKIVDLPNEYEAKENCLKLLLPAISSMFEQLAYFGGSWWSPKLKRCEVQGTSNIQIRNDKYYIFTGGLGGLGLEFATHFVEKGARKVILLGRNLPQQNAILKIENLKSLGAEVIVKQVDIGNESAVTALPWDQTCGVVHLAGTFADVLIRNMSSVDYEKVLLPKTIGTWNLHKASLKSKLDFFVCFSAEASLVPNPGQANYMAANSFLDLFHVYRSQQGLPCTTINWGAWAEIGIITEMSGVERILAERGIGLISRSSALNAFDRILSASLKHVAYMSLDWDKFSKSLPGNYSNKFLSEFTSRKLDRIAVPPQEVSLMGEEVKQSVKDILGRNLKKSLDSVDEDTPFSELGMDSLIAMEFRADLQKLFKLELPVSLVFDFPTIITLSDYIQSLNPIAIGNAHWEQQATLASSVQIRNPDLRKLCEGKVAALLAEVLKRKSQDFSNDEPFTDLGMDSLMAIEFKTRLEQLFRVSLSATIAFDYPTVADMSEFFQKEHSSSVQAILNSGSESSNTNYQKPVDPTFKQRDVEHLATVDYPESDDDVVVVGMSCRFPQDNDTPEKFWDFLVSGANATQEVPSDRWNISELYSTNKYEPGKMATKYGTFIKDVKGFDSDFFRITPIEAAGMDPQQRLTMECSWEAFEYAGIRPSSLNGSRTGVFIGCMTNDYAYLRTKLGLQGIDGHMATGNSHAVISGRISYFYGLRGPSMTIDTACSSSLVAIHLAAQSIKRGECDAALAGGVHLLLSPEWNVSGSKAGMFAPDGKCKTFDDSADGYVRGEGCGLLMLKRRDLARRDGNPILAIVRGTAVNQDGKSSGLTVPSGPAQQAVIRDALKDAKLKPSDVSYVEAHGTGTKLGDPIEVSSLAAVYMDGRTEDNPLLLGSVKTNIGHTEAAAGVAGVIKVILAMQNGVIPRHLNYNKLNSHIRINEKLIHITNDLTKWPRALGRRIAGVSSFGFSGTNSHILLEYSPTSFSKKLEPVQKDKNIFVISAKTAVAVKAQIEVWHTFLLARHGEAVSALEDLTLFGRDHHPLQVEIKFKNHSELLACLTSLSADFNLYLKDMKEKKFSCEIDTRGKVICIPVERIEAIEHKVGRQQEGQFLIGPRYQFVRRSLWLENLASKDKKSEAA